MPAGYVVMPCALSAENGAKAALTGEFRIGHETTCSGCYYDDESWEIIPRNYSGRGMRFRRGLSCIMVIAGNEALTTHIQGYPIPICVMNRIAFEQQRGSEG